MQKCLTREYLGAHGGHGKHQKNPPEEFEARDLLEQVEAARDLQEQVQAAGDLDVTLSPDRKGLSAHN